MSMLISPNGVTPPTFTWATKPAATEFSGAAFISDLGERGTLVYSDGIRYNIPKVSILSNGIPVYIPSSGSIGDNGALTLTTALSFIYPRCYLYFPANAIVAGSAAGLYYCVMSSTTVGVIYNNTCTSGTPTIPASPTAFATTGPGAYTQTTATDIPLLQVTIPGGLIGINGYLEYRLLGSHNNSASVKRTRVLFGGATTVSNATGTTSVSSDISKQIHNNGIENRQIVSQNIAFGGYSNSVPLDISTDTSANFVVAITGNLETVATDFTGIIGISISIQPS